MKANPIYQKVVTLMLFFIVFVSAVSFAQTPSESALTDLKQLSKKLSSRKYNFTLTYRLFESHTAKVPAETQVIDVKMWDLMINMSNKHFQIIRNKENYLYVNTDQKVIMVNSVKKYGAELKEFREMEHMFNLDSIMKFYKKVELLPAANGVKTYRFHMTDNYKFAYTDITIDPKQQQLQKVVIYYASSLKDLTGSDERKGLPRIEILFSNYQFPVKLSTEQFSTSKYVVKDKKRLKATKEYTSFRIIDNTY
jgi:sulfur relay (sulfurtransferase) DsrC/TusE family protein